uniref:Merozoite surface protein 37/41 n=1 Tax=Babesia capreoli TaxID=308426 RepID=E2CT68_9APIC|nr:merozoite surface protein 37/41 [Babesia capreoli]
MKTTKILNTAAVCLLAIGFKGQSVICTGLKGSEQQTTDGQGTTSPATPPASTPQTGGVSGQPATTGTPSAAAPSPAPPKVVVKSLEELRKELKDQRERVLRSIMDSEGPFSILQLIDFLRIIDSDLLLEVDQDMVKKAGEKVKKYLESIGIGGDSVEESLDLLMTKVYKLTRGTVKSPTESTDSESLNSLLLKFSEDIRAEQEHHGNKDESRELVITMGERYEALFVKFGRLSTTFLTHEEVSAYLKVPEYGAPMRATESQKVEKKIADKLKGSDLSQELKDLIAELIDLRVKLMDLLYGPIGHGDCAAQSGKGSGDDKPSFAAVPSSLCAIVFGIIVSMF